MVTIPTIDMVKTGQHIAELRVQAGLSVRQLQEIFGFSTPQALYKWQHGTARQHHYSECNGSQRIKI